MEPNQEFDAWAADEAIPAEPVGNLLSSPSRLHLLLVSQDPRMPVLANMNSLKASASKRPGEPPDASSNKEKRSFRYPDETDLDSDLAEFSLASGNDFHIRLDATDAYRESAFEFPAAGWSSCERLYNVARVARLAEEAFNTGPLRDLDPEKARARQRGRDPGAKALYD